MKASPNSIGWCRKVKIAASATEQSMKFFRRRGSSQEIAAMANYRLSLKANDDLKLAYLYGFENFGETQADAYAAGLIDCFQLLAGAAPHWTSSFGNAR